MRSPIFFSDADFIANTMTYYIIKILITTTLVILISEIAKRSSFMGSLLASLPLTSYLAMIWLYVDTANVEKVAGLSTGIFWLVIPSGGGIPSLPRRYEEVGLCIWLRLWGGEIPR